MANLYVWESADFCIHLHIKLVFCSVGGGYWQVGKQMKRSRPPAVADPLPNTLQHSHVNLKAPPPPFHFGVLTVLSHLTTAASSWMLWTSPNTHKSFQLFIQKNSKYFWVQASRTPRWLTDKTSHLKTSPWPPGSASLFQLFPPRPLLSVCCCRMVQKPTPVAHIGRRAQTEEVWQQ